MDKEDEFLYTYFTYITQLCFEKAKEHLVLLLYLIINYISLKIYCRIKNQKLQSPNGQYSLIFYINLLLVKSLTMKLDSYRIKIKDSYEKTYAYTLKQLKSVI